MRLLFKIPLGSIVMIFLGLIVQIGLKYYHKHPDSYFSFTQPQTILYKPDAVHSRYRASEYVGHPERVFFQWWNYLVFDAETRDHWNIIYQLSKFPNASLNNDTALVGYGHLQESTHISAARVELPISDAVVSNHFSVDYHVGNQIPYKHTVLDNDRIRIEAKFPASYNTLQKEVTWNLTFTRTHGFYGGLDTEKGNIDLCLMVSTLYGYNSMVEGTIKEGDKVYDIQKSPRFRAYGAGSWGCDLPNGTPPEEFPWTWFWLVIPGTTPDQDISMVFGTAKFQAPAPFYNLYGAYSATGLPGDKLIHSQLTRLNHGGALEMPIGASSNDGYLSSYTVNVSNWATFTDAMGSAQIPLIQTYHVDTANYTIDVHFNSHIEQYFRAPVVIEKDLITRVFSDFRAVGVETKIKIVKKATSTSSATIIYDGTINNMNALEYAYEPSLNREALKQYGFNIPQEHMNL